MFGLTRWFLRAALLLCCSFSQVPGIADTVVAFNEVMYHSRTNDLEWIELQNILARDIDMTGWRLDGGIHFDFPSGFVLKGGAFLVIANDPETLRPQIAGPNLLGPFTGKLANGGDKIVLRDNQDRVIDALEYTDDDPWPVGPDGGGPSLAKRKSTLASDDPKNWEASAEMGGSAGRSNSPPSSGGILLNECASGSDAQFWVELINSSTNNRDLAGLVIASSGGPETILTTRNLASAEIALISQEQIGFVPKKGDKLFLYSEGKINLLDSVVIESKPRGRNFQIPGGWFNILTTTPGIPNVIPLHDEIVINEIMYHPRFLADEAMQPAGGFIELYNRGKTNIDLSGWSLSDGAKFFFPPGTTMDADSYLVVAEDTNYLARLHPAVRILGNLQKPLSHKGARIVLQDLNGNLADEVTYFDGFPWPEAADGGGSSLELRDPRADNSHSSAWAASNEALRSEWINYSYHGIAGPNHTGKTYQEFILSLLDRGEVLLDNISVIENPRTAPAQLIQNGSFDRGVDTWRIIGTHHGEIVSDPSNMANKVLHLTANGPATDLHNHMETTLKKGPSFATIVPGREYEISFRAKWLSGTVLLNTRLFFNRVFRTTILDAPGANGTPGRRNSAYISNIGPTMANLRHEPLVPQANQNIKISIAASDPDRVLFAQVWLSTGKAWTNFPMQAINGHDFSVALPGLPGGTIGQFYVEASDNTDRTATYPSGGSQQPAFFQVAPSGTGPKNVHNLRIIMKPEDAAFMIQPQNLMSSDHLNATIVWDNSEAYYNVGVRLKGAPSSRSGSLAGYHLQFPKDHLFLGAHRTISIDRNNPSEILTKHLNQIAGIPSMYNDAIYVFAPQSDRSGYGQLRMAAFGDVYLDSQFKNGAAGPSYEKELIYMPDTTTTGSPEGYKIPSPYEHPPELNTDIANFGPDKESYRWNWLPNNNQDQDEYRRVVQLNQTFSLTGSALAQVVPDIIDVDQWLRTFAMVRLIGCRDFYTQPGGPPGSWNHNFIAYVRPEDNRILALPWDLDESFQEPINGSIIGNMNLAKIINIPANLRLTYGHYHDLITRFYTRDYMTRWGNHFATLLAGTDFNGPVNYILQRENYILTQLPKKVPFAISNPPSAVVASNSFTLKGTAWIDFKILKVAGAVPPPVFRWTTATNWEVDLALLPGQNEFQIEGCNFAGELTSSNSLFITSSSANGGLDSDADGIPDTWEAQYHLSTTMANASDDPDRDGMTNLEEYLAGTDPTDPKSRLNLFLSSDHTGKIELSFFRSPGRAYQIQSAQTLSESWQTFAQFPAELNASNATVPVAHPAAAAFYRLLLLQP